MRDKTAKTLATLIKQHGTELAHDSRRTEALLRDFCPDDRREIFVLVNAQRQQIPADLLAAPAWMPADVVNSRLSRRLQDRLALSEEAADWAVRSWSVALGLKRHNSHHTSSRLGNMRTAVLRSLISRPDQAVQRQSVEDGVQSLLHSGRAGQSAKPFVRVDKQGATHHNPVTQHDRRLFAWIAIVTTLAALAWVVTAGALTWDGLDARAGWGVAPSRIVARTYAVPQMAWVSEGPLLVRKGPGTTVEYLAMLNAGESVLVKRYSQDTQWSYIVDPTVGWVSNRYLYFLDPDNSQPVRLGLREVATLSDAVTVRAAPTEDSEAIGQLAAGETALAIAVTSDDRWLRIARPVVGWVLSQEMRSGAEE